MRGNGRNRQRGQVIVLAALAMVAVVGGLAIVVDAGIFYVVQQQLQTAADAGALAGAWYDPVCPVNADPCAAFNSAGLAPSKAQALALANANAIKQLCGGVVNVPLPTVGTKAVYSKIVNTIVVSVDCNAPYSFGRILNLTPKQITASAEAAIGDRDPNGDMANFTTFATTNASCNANPNPNRDRCRIARLIQ